MALRPEGYDYLEERPVGYAIRLPANKAFQKEMRAYSMYSRLSDVWLTTANQKLL